ncbi:hypothetical protein D3C72_1015790 [compost metagenome]
MHRQLVQRLPRVLAALLFRPGVRIAAGQRQGTRDRPAQAGFHAARVSAVHVHVRGGVGAELVGAIGALRDRAGNARDLVLEVVVEQRHAGLQAIALVIQQAEFLRQHGLGLQVRVAVHVAAAAGLAPAGHGLAQVRRAEAGGDAPLDGPALGRLPHAVQARAVVLAEILVVVHAHTAGQREALRQAPFILGEERPLVAVDLVRAVGDLVAGLVVQALAQVLGADREHVAAQRHGPAGAQVQVPDLHPAAAVVELFLLDIAVRDAEAPAAGMRQRELPAAVVGLGRGRAAGARTAGAGRERRHGLAHGLAAQLAHGGGFQHDVVVARGRERQLGGQALGAAAAEAVVDIVFDAVRALAVQLQAEQVVLERAGQVEVALVDVAGVAVFLQRGVPAQFAGPPLGDLARDDIDHAAHGIRAIQRRHRPAHHLDALDRRQRRRPAAFNA